MVDPPRSSIVSPTALRRAASRFRGSRQVERLKLGLEADTRRDPDPVCSRRPVYASEYPRKDLGRFPGRIEQAALVRTAVAAVVVQTLERVVSRIRRVIPIRSRRAHDIEEPVAY